MASRRGRQGVRVTDARPRAIYLLGHTPFPPVTGGGRRASSIVEVLAERYDVAVLAADDTTSSDPSWASAARRLVARRHIRLALARDTAEGLIRGQHVLLTRSIHAGILDAFRARLQAGRPELVLLGRPFLGPYVDAALEVAPCVVVDADESMPRVAFALARSRHAPMRRRLRAWLEAAVILGRMERAAYQKASQVWVSSELERAAFASLVPAGRLHVVPNVMPAPDEAPAAPPITAVAFIGSYFYPPNEAAALELMSTVMPALRARGGPRRLVLMGPDATPAMLEAIARDPEVDLLGQVPEVRGPLRAAGVLAVPIRAGGGTRMKILEAMAAGVPVVSTSRGIEGLDLQDDRDVLVAESGPAFASRVSRLTEDQALRGRLVDVAFEYVRRHHSVDVLEAAIAQCLGWADDPGLQVDAL